MKAEIVHTKNVCMKAEYVRNIMMKPEDVYSHKYDHIINKIRIKMAIRTPWKGLHIIPYHPTEEME